MTTSTANKDDRPRKKRRLTPTDTHCLPVSESISGSGSGSGSTPSTSASTPAPAVTTKHVMKCSKCPKLGRKSCSQKACIKCCTDKNCIGHRDVREKEEILNGTHTINKIANAKRARAMKPNAFFHDPAFHYLGETIMIWNFAEYMSNSKWRDEAIRRSLRNIQSRKQAVMVEKEAQRRREKKINGGNCVHTTVNANANGGGGRSSGRSSGISNEKEKDDIAEDDGDNKETNSILCTRLHRKETRRQRFERIMNELYQQTLVSK